MGCPGRRCHHDRRCLPQNARVNIRKTSWLERRRLRALLLPLTGDCGGCGLGGVPAAAKVAGAAGVSSSAPHCRGMPVIGDAAEAAVFAPSRLRFSLLVKVAAADVMEATNVEATTRTPRTFGVAAGDVEGGWQLLPSSTPAAGVCCRGFAAGCALRPTAGLTEQLSLPLLISCMGSAASCRFAAGRAASCARQESTGGAPQGGG